MNSTNQSIAVCTVLYESGDVVGDFFLSVGRHLGPDDEILLFDNSPMDGLSRQISDLEGSVSCSVKYWFSGENLGFARACNSLALRASAGRLIFLNPDTKTVDFDCREHRRDEVVGARILDPSGREEGTYGRNRGLRDEISLRWFRRRSRRPDGRGYVSGAAISVDREVFLTNGGFDESFFMYYEDIDLCLRLGNKGCFVRVSDEWKVIHQGGSAARKIRTQSEIRSFDSAYAFHRKWNHRSRSYVLWCFVDSVIRIPIWVVLGRRTNVRAQVALASHIFQKMKDLGKTPANET